jgi:DNA-binding transcriptional MerR regulator
MKKLSYQSTQRRPYIKESNGMRMRKKQFRIGHLAAALGVDDFVIRFWEKEFKLPTNRSQGGQRFYTAEDLERFKNIHELLYKKGFTIAGAKQELNQPVPQRMRKPENHNHHDNFAKECAMLKKRLLALKDML